MPCYLVQTCSVSLLNANPTLLAAALAKLGYTVVRSGNGKIQSFSRERVTGTYDGKTLTVSGPGGTQAQAETNEIRRGYTDQIMQKRAQEFRKKGWTVTHTGNRWHATKPQMTTKVRA